MPFVQDTIPAKDTIPTILPLVETTSSDTVRRA
jgi:hypothetical protein